MMSTSSHSKAENGVIQSSIGLLQERFRQLQRMKEMRENKELLRMFSDYNNNNNSTCNTNTNTNNNNNNNNTTTTTNVSPIIVSNTSYTTSTITSTTTISGTPISNNNNMNTNDNKNNISDSSMQYNDQLQIFIPPNYSSLNNPKSSCYSSSSSAASSSIQAPSSSSSSSSRNSNMINPSDVSLSLWSYSNSTPAATTYPFRRENSDNLLSTMNMQQPVARVAVSRASTTCVSTFYNKLEDPRHVTDVDTTLHL